jgi:type I restriction enzyme R subunit
VFGDYVSVYNFARSIEDGATVPLYYENRIPELQLVNENFADELASCSRRPSSTRMPRGSSPASSAPQYTLLTRPSG